MPTLSAAFLVSALTLLSSLPARADLASDLSTAMTNYTTAVNAFDPMSKEYATYSFGTPYQETPPGSGKWAPYAITAGNTTHAGSAETLLGIATTRCAAQSGKTNPYLTDAESAWIAYRLATNATPWLNAYKTAKDKFCAALYIATQLQIRIAQLQALMAKANAAGWIPLMAHSFNERLHIGPRDAFTRTIQGGITLSWNPNLVNTLQSRSINLQDILTYDTWFKWSDDPRIDLSIAKKIGDFLGSSGVVITAGETCDTLISGPVAKAQFCITFPTATGNWTNDPITIKAKIHIDGDHGYHHNIWLESPFNISGGTSGSQHMWAPGKYLNELSQMISTAKQNLVTNVKNQLLTALKTDQATLTAIYNDITAACTAAAKAQNQQLRGFCASFGK